MQNYDSERMRLDANIVSDLLCFKSGINATLTVRRNIGNAPLYNAAQDSFTSRTKYGMFTPVRVTQDVLNAAAYFQVTVVTAALRGFTCEVRMEVVNDIIVWTGVFTVRQDRLGLLPIQRRRTMTTPIVI